MKKEKSKKITPFKDVWTHIPTSEGMNNTDKIADWIKNVILEVKGSERKILVVEDEPEVLNSLKIILEHEGYSVDTATNGIEALDKLSQVDFNLILSDIRMPVMDGIELCEITKNHPELNKIPVVLFSGYYGSFESCADYFLAKPIDAQSLLNIIRKIFKKYKITKEIEKIGKVRKKIKHLQIIQIGNSTSLTQLQRILDFIWIFQPKYIPLLKISHEIDLSIDEIRKLLDIVDKQDIVLIVKNSPILRTLLKSEITFLGGNSDRIFDTLDSVKKSFNF